MSNVNKIILLGTVAEKPVTRFGMENNSAVATFKMAVERPARMDGTKESDYVPVVAFGANAELAAEQLQQGSLVMVDGRLQVRTIDKDGQREWLTEVIAGIIKPIVAGSAVAVAGARVAEVAAPESFGDNPFAAGLDSQTEDDVPF